MTEHLTSTSWVIFFKVLSVNKLCPVFNFFFFTKLKILQIKSFFLQIKICKMADQKEDLKGYISCE